MKNCILSFLFVLLTIVPATSSRAKQDFTFEGSLDFSRHIHSFRLDAGQDSFVSFDVTEADKDVYKATLKAEHFQTPMFNLTSELESVIHVKEDAVGETVFEGSLRSQYSLIDFKPVKEVTGRFSVKNDELLIQFLEIGQVGCNGRVNLKAPYDVDLNFKMASLPLPMFLDFWVDELTIESSGYVSGQIEAIGQLDELLLRGRIEGSDGHIDDLNFDSFLLNAEGNFPLLLISESRVAEKGGMSFTVEGPFDLSKQDTFEQQAEELALAPIVQTSESKTEWTIKSVGEQGAKTELKYLKRKDSEQGRSSEEDLDMLGVQRTMEF